MGTDPNKKKRKKGKETLESKAQEPAEKQGGISRRALLKGTAAAAALQTLLQGTGAAVLATAGASLVAPEKAHAQEAGLMPEGGTVPFRLPMGALNYLDRKEYIHNMKIISYTPGVMAATAEPLLNMWAKGAQRVLPIAGGGFLDVSNPKKPEVIAKHSYNGFLTLVVYNTKLKKWILMSAASAPITSATPEYPHGQYDLAFRRKSDRLQRPARHPHLRHHRLEKPKLLQEFSTGATGNGTHMNFYDGGQYAFLDCGWDDQLRMENAQRPFSNGLMIVDMSDPSNVKEVSRWWVPGQRYGEEAEYKKWIFANDQSSWTSAHGAPVVPKRIEDGGTIGYGGFGAFGMFVFDFSDIKHPKAIRPRVLGIRTDERHSLPLALSRHHRRSASQTEEHHLFNGRMPLCRRPRSLPYAACDRRQRPAESEDHRFVPAAEGAGRCSLHRLRFARGRFGSHNPQAWVAPGRMRPEIAGMAFFNAGCRLFDISEPTAPREVAWYVPPHSGEMDNYESWWRGTAETIFIEWDRNLIWLGCHAGTYCLSSPVLGEPVLEARKIERWTVPHINLGWDG